MASRLEARADGRPHPSISPAVIKMQELDSARARLDEFSTSIRTVEHRQDSNRGEHPVEFCATRYLGDYRSAERDARSGFVQGGAYLSRDVFDVTVSQFDVPERRPCPHLRQLAASVQRAAPGGGRLGKDGGVRRHRRRTSSSSTRTASSGRIASRPRSRRRAAGGHWMIEEPLRAECQHFLDCVQHAISARHRSGRRRTAGPAGPRRLPPVADQRRASSTLASCRSELRDAAHISRTSPPTSTRAREIGEGTKIWHFAHIMKGARSDDRCVIGQNVNIDGRTVIGNNVKIQNNVSVYSGVTIEDDVFLGPSCVLTNVTNPRSQVGQARSLRVNDAASGSTIGRMRPSSAARRSAGTLLSPPAPWSQRMCPTTR